MIEAHELSSEQKAVLNSKASKLSVIASAGAGKTGVLTARYLQHVLQEGLEPDRILTITFTRKAAAEMKGRIVEGLRKAGALHQAQNAESGPIQTIHGLCEQLLRENAILAGIDPKFEILSEAGSQKLYNEAIEEAIAEIDSDWEEAELLLGKLAGIRTYQGPSPYSLLLKSVRETISSLRGAGVSVDQMESIYGSAPKFEAHWTKALLAAQPPTVLSLFSQGPGDDWKKDLTAAYRTARVAVPNWLKNIPNDADELFSNRETCGVVQLAIEAWRRLEAKMDSEQKFDFSYLESKAAELLASHESLRSNLEKKFEIVMVDEAQDLNHNQYRLLDQLNPRVLLSVGDGQQSIYGFRHADLDRFNSAQTGEVLRLTKNFRSEPGIVRFVDRVFQGAWSEKYQPMMEPAPFDLNQIDAPNYDGVEIWEMPDPNLRWSAFYTAKLIDEGANPGDICVLTRDSAASQTLFEALKVEGVDSKILGGSEKFYTRMEVRDLANLLRALADPYQDFSLLAVLYGPAVNLSLDAIVRLGLQKPVIENYRSVEVSEMDRKSLEIFSTWFEPIRSYADRLSAWEVISEIFASTPFLTGIARNDNGLQQTANLRKLLSLASQEPSLGPLEFADQIREIQQMRHKEGEAETTEDTSKLVKVMTIHKSKGLEFPIVILPDTDKTLTKAYREVIYDSRLNLISAKFGNSAGLFHKFIEHRMRERALEEELRVLYVAMTRAQKLLCVALYPNNNNRDTLSKRLRTILGNSFLSEVKVRQSLQVVAT